MHDMFVTAFAVFGGAVVSPFIFIDGAQVVVEAFRRLR